LTLQNRAASPRHRRKQTKTNTQNSCLVAERRDGAWGSCLWKAWAAGVCLALVLPFSLFAKERTEDVSAALAQARATASSAKLILLPSTTAYVVMVREEDMPKYGCMYLVERKEDLADLFDIIERASIKPSDVEPRPNDLRISIVLTSGDGSNLKLLFAGLRRVDGNVHGTVNGTASIANPGFPAELRTWAATARTPFITPQFVTCGK
jgi:hypothetical protein